MSVTQNVQVFYNSNVKCMHKNEASTPKKRTDKSILVKNESNSENKDTKNTLYRKDWQNRGKGRGRGGYFIPSDPQKSIQVNESVKSDSHKSNTGRGGYRGRSGYRGRGNRNNSMQRTLCTPFDDDLSKRRHSDNFRGQKTEKNMSTFDMINNSYIYCSKQDLHSQKDNYAHGRGMIAKKPARKGPSQDKQINEPCSGNKNIKNNYNHNGGNKTKELDSSCLYNDMCNEVENNTARNYTYRKYQRGKQRGSFRHENVNKQVKTDEENGTYDNWSKQNFGKEPKDGLQILAPKYAENRLKNEEECAQLPQNNGGKNLDDGKVHYNRWGWRINKQKQEKDFDVETYTKNTNDIDYTLSGRGRGRGGYRRRGRGRGSCGKMWNINQDINNVNHSTQQERDTDFEISSTPGVVIKKRDNQSVLNALTAVQVASSTLATKERNQVLVQQNKSRGQNCQNSNSQPSPKFSLSVVSEPKTKLVISKIEDKLNPALLKDTHFDNVNCSSTSKSSVNTTKSAPVSETKSENIHTKHSFPAAVQHVTHFNNSTTSLIVSSAALPNNNKVNHSRASVQSNVAALKTVRVQSPPASAVSRTAQQNMPPTVSKASQSSYGTTPGLLSQPTVQTKSAHSASVLSTNTNNSLTKHLATITSNKNMSSSISSHGTVNGQVRSLCPPLLMKNESQQSIKKKLSFEVTDSCKLVIKSYGSVVTDKSDIIVSFLDSDLNLKNTATGQAILRVSPNHKAEIIECQTQSFACVYLKYYPQNLSCKAIYHVVYNSWLSGFSKSVFHDQLEFIFDEVVKLQAKTVSFPPLCCDKPFYFSAKTVVPFFLYFLSNLNIENCLSKIVVHATSEDVFQEFKRLTPFYFLEANKIKKNVSLYSPLFLPLQRNTVNYLKYALKNDTIFPSYWNFNDHTPSENNDSETSWGTGFLKSIVSAVYTWFSGESIPDFKFAKLVNVDYETKIAITDLVNRTLHQNVVGHGADAIGVRYSSVKIVDVKRIENRTLFQRYHETRKRVMEKMIQKGSVCRNVGTLEGSSGNVVTWNSLPESLKKELYSEINEHFLFHGTNTNAVHSIIEHGFDLKYSNEWCLFGKGIYFAEKAMKSDQYTDKHNRCPNGTKLTMILTRMLLGDVFVCNENHAKVASLDPSKRFKKPPCMTCYDDCCSCGRRDHCDSVMGDGRWLFREFVVYDASQCYPEFIITYERA